MRYALIKKNDIANGKGVCVSFWTQGCHWHCKNCHNEETWSPEGGKEFNQDVIQEILEAIPAYGIQRNFSVLGGEPLGEYSSKMTLEVVSAVRKAYPNITIYLWTGYKYTSSYIQENEIVKEILTYVNVLIDGLYIENLKDLRLEYRGSSNQDIIYLRE